MDPRDLDLIKRAISEALSGQSDSHIMMICGVLSSVIGVLWAWGFKQSQAWVAKIEELSKDQRRRDDERESTIRERFENVIGTLSEEHKTELKERDKRIDRLEQARDLARDQYNTYRIETEGWTRGQIVEITQQLLESGKTCESMLDYLEKTNREM